MQENVRLPLFLLRCPKFCSAAPPLQNFDRGHSSRSLAPPPEAVALVPLHPKELYHKGKQSFSPAGLQNRLFSAILKGNTGKVCGALMEQEPQL